MNIVEYVAKLTTIAAVMKLEHHHALEKGGEVIEKEAKRVIGTYDYGWPPLAPSTLEKKKTDTPLLETGELRESITSVVQGHSVFIGSDPGKFTNNDPQVAVWQELGTRKIPPRSYLMGAAVHKGKEAALVVANRVLLPLIKKVP